MRPSDLSAVAAQLEGMRERRREGLLDWRHHGRLVARQLDEPHILIRASFLEHRNADAIEDAALGAWELQSGG